MTPMEITYFINGTVLGAFAVMFVWLMVDKAKEKPKPSGGKA